MQKFARFLPFLRWFPLTGDTVKADFMAGITVALVLIPQSMAYAQLAGLPAYYGLYAAFLPVAVAALWGSSHQLGTGPVAVVSLLTASSLAVYATPGSPDFVALAIMLALLVGVIQLLLGVFKLGVIVNFLSHPVIVGFTNAAAIIIALSQVSKLFGVPMARSEHFMHDIVGVFGQLGDTHLPTLAMGIAAIAIMWAVKRFAPRLPGVLIAVALTTLAAWGMGFEKKATLHPDGVADPLIVDMLREYETTAGRLAEMKDKAMASDAEAKRLEKQAGHDVQQALTLNYRADMLHSQVHALEEANAKRLQDLRRLRFEREVRANGEPGLLHLAGTAPIGMKTDGGAWKIATVAPGEIRLTGGGEVVGGIPEGLPSFALPRFDLDKLGTLLSAALVISLVGFMEAISIAKAIAARTKQRLDPNQELVGQGLANIVGSMTQAFPVSGSFSRSAVNMNSGARSGMSSVFTAVFVLLTLLFLTPLLYHLPQAVLAAIIIMAVAGLVNVRAIRHAWQANRHDGIAAVVTFVATLAYAPHLDNGIMVGAGLALVLFLLRTMKPRVAQLGRFKDGTLRDIKVYPELPTSEHMVAMRFDGQLYFANVSYFEDTLLATLADHPKARFLLVVGDGINQLDASGEEVIHHLVSRLKENGVTLVFSGLKKQVLDVMRATGLFDLITQDNIFATEDQAIAAIYERLGDEARDDLFCALKPAMA
ncbi:MAG TPA: SulP family inorganic anion transporter [Thiobacillaceae bacterium]|nr:SulP family inorganic anion transporter [Thiobacillaceae bacterium]HNU65095.1 SulP family inorganic anion transporter [Thiobacillaceae bacterium]